MHQMCTRNSTDLITSSNKLIIIFNFLVIIKLRNILRSPAPTATGLSFLKICGQKPRNNYVSMGPKILTLGPTKQAQQLLGVRLRHALECSRFNCCYYFFFFHYKLLGAGVYITGQ